MKINKYYNFFLILVFISCSNYSQDNQLQYDSPLNNYTPLIKSREIEWITAGDLSGVTLNFNTGTLFFIENRHNTIWESDTNMNLIRTINGKDFGDSEDIVYLGNQEFGIINEEGYLFLGNIPLGENDISINSKNFNKIKYMDHIGNKGPEGLAFDKRENIFFSVKEKNPMVFYYFQLTDLKTNKKTIDPIVPFDINKWDDNVFTDLSGALYDDRSGRVLVLSDESKKIIDINYKTGEILGSLNVDEMYQPEGLSFYNKNHDLLIVSEPNFFSKYRFKKNK